VPSTFSTFDGLTLAFSEQGEGSTVVLLHGFGSNTHDNWAVPGVIDALVGGGHRVIGLDARGHGFSDKPHEPAAYNDAAMGRDVVALFEHLGLETADVAGYSMGAGTALWFASTVGRVRRLLLAAFNGPFGDQLEELSRRETRNHGIAEALSAADPTVLVDDEQRMFRRFAEQHGADRVALAAIQRSQQLRSMVTDPGAIDVPTLVMSGDRDFDPEPIARRLPLGRFQLVRGSHLSAVSNPAFARAAVDFFAE
jgi:pimeloyl-ACP methyl ester carboxylesterase